MTEGIGPLSRRPPPGGARREWQLATVAEVLPQTARMKSFVLKLPAGTAHVPGQHYVVRLTAPDGYAVSRSYSVASAPGDGSHIELMVERLEEGEVSSYLHEEIRPGDDLEVRGPFGGWFLWKGRTPAILVGGGSGVVPLVSMLRHRRAVAPQVPMHLVVSVRGPEELPFAGELFESPDVTVLYTRRTPPGHPRPAGRIGPDDLRPALISGAAAYVCGSAGFAEAASQLLVELGVAAPDVRVERYGPTS